jgi:hypothetical protein
MSSAKVLIFLSILWGTTLSFSQNVSGIPESTVPVNGAYFAFSTENDIYGSTFFNENDDLRTFSFNAEFFPIKNYGIMITYDSLTDRGSDGDQGRIDALIVTLGYRALDMRGETHSFSLLVGSGARLYGDLGGEVFQKSFHESRDIKRPIELPYDSYQSAGALGYLSGRWWINSQRELSDSLFLMPPGLFVFSAGNEIRATTLVEFQSTLDLTLSLETQNSIIATGLEYYFGSSQVDSNTVATVNEYESGFWFKYAFYVGCFFSSYGFHLSNGISQGNAGFAFGDFYDATHRSTGHLLVFEYGFSMASFNMINQIRWQPRAFRGSHSFARNLMLVFDYRGGNGPPYQYPQNAVLMDQYCLGVSFNLFPIRKGFQLNPFLTGLVGIRNELLCPQCNSRTHAIDRALYPVVQGETGLRLTYGPYESRTLYGLGIAFEGFTQLPTINSDPGKFYEATFAHDLSVSIRILVIAVN